MVSNSIELSGGASNQIEKVAVLRMLILYGSETGTSAYAYTHTQLYSSEGYVLVHFIHLPLLNYIIECVHIRSHVHIEGYVYEMYIS